MLVLIMMLAISGWGFGISSLTLFGIRKLKERSKWLEYAGWYSACAIGTLVYLQITFFINVFIRIPYDLISNRYPIIGFLGSLLLGLQSFFYILFILEASYLRLNRKMIILILAASILLSSGRLQHYGLSLIFPKRSPNIVSWHFHNIADLLLLVLAAMGPSLYCILRYKVILKDPSRRIAVFISVLHLLLTPLYIITFFTTKSTVLFLKSEHYFNYFIFGIIAFIFFIASMVYNAKAIKRYQFPLPEEIPDPVVREYKLTSREKEVLEQILQGLRPAEIGEKLFISVKTVNAHIYSLYRKFDVSGRPELMDIVQKIVSVV